jgi:hypothetical protein
MRIVVYNNAETNEVSIQLFFPQGGALPSGVEKVKPGEAVLLDVKAGAVEELQREEVKN